MFTTKCVTTRKHALILVGWLQSVRDSCKVERMETGAGDWLLCPLTGLWGESRWRPRGDTMEVYGGHAGRQTVQRVLGADKSSPHRPDEGFTCYWPARTACPQSLPTLNGLVEKESHKLADEQRWGRLCLPPASSSLLLSHILSLSFLYQVVVSISPNPFPPECLKRWKDKEKNGDKRGEGYVTTLPLRDCSWKSLGMGEIGTGEETQKEKGDHEKRFFKLKAAKTGHFCIERQAKVQPSLRDGDI